MAHYVYGLFTKDSNKLFYIGISSGSKNLYHRQKNHMTESSNPRKMNMINKHGMCMKIIWKVKTRIDAEQREEFLIRWFGRESDGGILVNFAKHSKDTSFAYNSHTEQTRKKISTIQKKLNKKEEYRRANRDRNLTVPYDDVISLLDQWAKNPFESQTSFANRNGIKRSMFKDWLRLYKPEYIGLQKRELEKILCSINNIGRPKDIIFKISEMTGFSLNNAKKVYYDKYLPRFREEI